MNNEELILKTLMEVKEAGGRTEAKVDQLLTTQAAQETRISTLEASYNSQRGFVRTVSAIGTRPKRFNRFTHRNYHRSPLNGK
jgi:hypothetical protein